MANAALLAVLALIGWLVGSLLLRLLGWAWIIFGLLIATTIAETPDTYALAAFNIALGTGLWLGGHALYAARHHHWKSPTAYRILTFVPRTFRAREHDTR